MSKSEQCDNKFLYTLKGLACIMVVFIHCSFPGYLGVMVTAIARAAVPLFFSISGYFLTRSSYVSTRQALLKRIKRIVKTIIFVWGIYAAYALIRCCFLGIPVKLYVDQKINKYNILTLLVFNHSRILEISEYTPDSLWFLFALLYTYILIYILVERIKNRELYYTVPLIICNIAIQAVLHGKTVILFGSRYNVAILVINFLFDGVPFFILGMWIRRFNNKIANWININLLFVLAAAEIIERVVFWSQDLYISSFLFVVVALLLANVIPQKSIRIFSYIGKHLSADVYYFHVLFKCMIFDAIGESTISGGYRWILPIFVLFITLCIAQIIYIFRKNGENLHEGDKETTL